ncbi:MAG TPA: serine/threonine-protein kinase [Streptosporangiaceae bacterium]|nr:serine/threonine-protein kinase [Streptosporangiaceae bacterium]
MEPLAADDPASVGPYRLVARLGSGGMGRVYLGFSGGKRAVAVKVIHAEHARDDEFRARFRTEVAAARQVNAAFTAPVIDAGENDDPPWLVTAFVAGPSLAEVVKGLGILPEQSVWRLIAGLAEALQAVHACDLVHRDLKPANVLIAADGPRLIDFGLSRALDASSVTATGYVVGTPAFMSPEQIASGRIGPESDVFSLGALLVFAATGHPPFGTGNSADLFFRVLEGEPEYRELTGPLRDLAAWCLAKDPSGRPSPAEIMEAVPDRASPTAMLSLMRFWPVAVDSFIAAYQERLVGAIPEPDDAEEPPRAAARPRRAAQPFRPPREIAAEAAGLAESGQVSAARQLLSSAARLRPDQEVAALITTLRDGQRYSDAETVISAAALRPAGEVAALVDVLRQIGVPEEADRVLDQAGFREPSEIGPLAGALAEQGRTREVRRLLHSAITVHRSPAAVVALVGALSSAGLGTETGRLMALLAAARPDVEAASLADALRAAGLDDAAFRLYSSAVGPVAQRSPDELASLLAAMRGAGRDEEADQLISAVSSAHRTPGDVAELAGALSSASLDSDSRRVLHAAVSVMEVGEIVGIAGSLLAMDRADAALSLYVEAAARYPAAASATFVQALRDAGRPVDASRVLDSSRDWPPAKTAQLIAALRESGAGADADRVIFGSKGRGTEELGDLMAELTSLGVGEDSVRVAGLAPFDDAGLVCDLVVRMVAQNRLEVAHALLAQADAAGTGFWCDLAGNLARRGQRGAVAFLIEQQAKRDNPAVLRSLSGLRGRGNNEAAGQLLADVAKRPADDIASLAAELAKRDPQEVIALIASMKAGRQHHIGQVLAAALPALGARQAEFLVTMAGDPRVGLATVAAALEAPLPDYLAALLQFIVGRYKGAGGDLGRIVDDLSRAGLRNVTHLLLEIAATRLNSADYCALYGNLRLMHDRRDADYLLGLAPANSSFALLVVTLRDAGYHREARQLRKANPRR